MFGPRNKPMGRFRMVFLGRFSVTKSTGFTTCLSSTTTAPFYLNYQIVANYSLDMEKPLRFGETPNGKLPDAAGLHSGAMGGLVDMLRWVFSFR